MYIVRPAYTDSLRFNVGWGLGGLGLLNGITHLIYLTNQNDGGVYSQEVSGWLSG